MVSKFTGRDYNTLRTQIIDFLRERLPREWDYTNLSDPVIVFAESLARIGDQLHFTIDELRRECDVATAKRASSIYSYAMREGYKMFLPRSPFGELSINSIPEQDGMLHISLNKFDPIILLATGSTLYVADDKIDADLHSQIDYDYLNSLSDYIGSEGKIDKDKRNIYNAYVEDVYSKTVHVNVVLGSKGEYNFTYSDINEDSTVELPNPMIDRRLVRLRYSNATYTNRELQYVDDVISSGFNKESFTLTPKFIGGAITLCIEFPTNYKDIFSDISTKFTFEYIEIENARIDPLPEYSLTDATDFGGAITVISGYEEDLSIIESGPQYVVDFGNGIKGYAEYEDANVTREQYKKFVQNYSSLLTKDDYANYIKTVSSSYCKVFDHGDLYKNPPVLPEKSNLLPRVLYILTDAPYTDRESMWYDLVERSSRSDCIILTPFGKDPYTIVVKADCYLVGTSASSVATAIKNELTKYYAGNVGEKIPKLSMIDYITHKASDKVLRMESCIVRDTSFGTIDTTLNNVNQLSNDELDKLYAAFKNGTEYVSPITDDTQTTDDYRHWLRTKRYVDSQNKEVSPDETGNYITVYTNKYPLLTFKEKDVDDTDHYVEVPISEYKDFPDSFPEVYYVHNGNEERLDEYDSIIEHQVTYGECDSRDWDISDTAIFIPTATSPIPLPVPNDGPDPNTEQPLTYVFDYTPTGSSEETPVTAYIQADNVTKYEDGGVTKYKAAHNTDIYSTDPFVIEADNLQTYKIKSIVADTELKNCKLYSKTGFLKIDDDYVKHHYMVPVLNKVVVLIKAVNPQ